MNGTIFEESICGIQINHACRDSRFRMDTRHMHDEYEIYYLVSGERYYFIGEQTYLIKAGGLALINRNEIHKTGQVKSAVHERILLSLSETPISDFTGYTDEFSLEDFFAAVNRGIQLSQKQSHLVEMRLREILDIACSKESGYKLMLLSKTTELLLFLQKLLLRDIPAKKTAPQSEKHKKVNEITIYLSQHFKEPISLNDAANKFFLNKSYLSRIFKEITGFTVTEYINTRRIQEARKKLTNTTHSITKISESVGYDSITYFERVFKNHCRMTPVEYRNSMASK